MIPIKSTEWLKDDGLLQIEGWARDGLTDAQVANNMGIAYSTFREWIEKFPAISAALKRGKAPVDIEVENALLKRAMGYDYEETVTEIYKGEGGVERQHIRKLKKHLPPDTTAQIFWLKNRRPDKWRDRRVDDVTIQTADYDALNEAFERLMGDDAT